jgi:hypothetical protein
MKLKQLQHKNNASVKQFYRTQKTDEYKDLPYPTQNFHECVIELKVSNQATKHLNS